MTWQFAGLASNTNWHRQEYTTGSNTFTIPIGVTLIYLTMVGGGGGSTGNNITGGGGMTIMRLPVVVTGLTSITVAIGAGGPAGSFNGGDTTATVGSQIISAWGGEGGGFSDTSRSGRGGGNMIRFTTQSAYDGYLVAPHNYAIPGGGGGAGYGQGHGSLSGMGRGGWATNGSAGAANTGNGGGSALLAGGSGYALIEWQA